MDNQDKPLRLKFLLRQIIGGSLETWLVVGVAVLSPLPVLLVMWSSIEKVITGRTSEVVSTAISVFIALALYRLYRNWWRARTEFTKSEHRLILAVMVLFTSLVVGAVNAGIYAFDKRAFDVDKKAIESWARSHQTTRTAAIARSKQLISDADTLAVRMRQLRQQQIRFRESSVPGAIRETYEVDLPWTDVKVSYIKSDATKISPQDTWTLKASFQDGRELDLNFLRHGAIAYLKPPQNGVLQRDDLAAAFAYRSRWERTERLPILEQRVRETLPPTAFLYQWTMSALGENPRYANPNSFLTRTLALLFALAKYLFLGVFVALVMDEVGRSTARKET